MPLPINKPGVSSGLKSAAPSPAPALNIPRSTGVSTTAAYQSVTPPKTIAATVNPVQSAAAIITAHVSNATAMSPAVGTVTKPNIGPINPQLTPPGGYNAAPARPTTPESAAETTPVQTPQQSAPMVPYADSPYVPAPYQSDASQALYNDPNLPSQTFAVPDDAHAWNDPAPKALVNSAVQSATVTNPGIAPKPSLWTRILTFLGIIKTPVLNSTHAIHGESITIEEAAERIVRRIRNGDQNAMGLAIMIGDNARKGDKTAQRTYRLMEAYCDRTQGATHAGEPSRRQPVNMGRETVNRGWAKAVYLANGPLLQNDKVADVAASFGSEGQARSFIHGVMVPTHPAMNEAQHHGKVVGMARKIQAVRMPGSRISDYSATVGWELGE